MSEPSQGSMLRCYHAFIDMFPWKKSEFPTYAIWICSHADDARTFRQGWASRCKELPGQDKLKNGLRWHKLTAISRGDEDIEVMAATCIDGIGVIVRWKKESDEGWEVEAIDTESGQWEFLHLTEHFNEIPAEPPTEWNDR